MIKELGEKFTVRGRYNDEPPAKPSRKRAVAY
jgi:hypothetical protein